MRTNSTTTLAGSGLPRSSTPLREVDSNGQVVGSPDREIEDAVGFAVPSSQCAICLRPFTDGHGDVCADCWSFIPHDKMTTWDWAILRGVSARSPDVPGFVHLAYTGWPMQSILPPEPRHGFDCKTNPMSETLARIVKDALEHPHLASADPWIKTPEQWVEFGPDAAVFVHTPVFGSPFALPYVPAVTVVEGTLHVKCAMPGCTSEYESNEKPSSEGVRYVCSKHTNAELRRARILKTDRGDRDVHFDEPKYRFNHKKPGESREWDRHKFPNMPRQSFTQYARNHEASDPGHSPISDGVHRRNTYKPFDPIEVLFESHPTLFAARRGDTGEGVEHAPDNTPAQRRRLKEIVGRWQGRIELAKRQGLLNDNPTQKQVIEFLRQDKHFAADAADAAAIDEGERLANKMETKRRRDRMQIISNSVMDALHPKLNWNQLLKSEQFRPSIFLLVGRERYRLYYLGALDMPIKLSPLGLPINPINEAFWKLVNKSVGEARRMARKRKLDENQEVERVFEQFTTGEIIWVNRVPRSQKSTANRRNLE